MGPSIFGAALQKEPAGGLGYEEGHDDAEYRYGKEGEERYLVSEAGFHFAGRIVDDCADNCADADGHLHEGDKRASKSRGRRLGNVNIGESNVETVRNAEKKTTEDNRALIRGEHEDEVCADGRHRANDEVLPTAQAVRPKF